MDPRNELILERSGRSIRIRALQLFPEGNSERFRIAIGPDPTGGFYLALGAFVRDRDGRAILETWREDRFASEYQAIREAAGITGAPIASILRSLETAPARFRY